MHFPPVENATRGGEVHILTGVNGTGKTRVLAILAAILGNPAPLLARVTEEQKPFFFETDDGHGGRGGSPRYPEPADAALSSTCFSFGLSGDNLRWGHKPAVKDSIPAYAYTGEAYLTASVVKGSMEAVGVPARTSALAFQKPEAASQSLSQLLYNLTIMGANDIRTHRSLEVAEKESRPLRLLTQIEVMLGRLTGRRVSFEPVPTPTTRLMVRWGNAKALPFNLLPDGLRSILGWLVELAVMMDIHYPTEEEPWKKPLIVLLDEVERHLHPGWQRQVLPIAQEMFPNAQFFVATYSPFIIASLNEGWIHHLNLPADGRVTADPPIPASEGDSYVSVMGSIMGVTELYDPETEGLLEDYRELRTKALRKEPGMKQQALSLSERIALRGPELAYMMEKEKAQMERLLNGTH